MTTLRAAPLQLLGKLQAGVHRVGAPAPVRRLADRAPRRAYEILSSQGREVRRARRLLAQRFLEGDGLEIGALNLPLPLPRKARARYVDRMTAAQLREEYPEWASWDLVDPDVVDDGERLTTIPDASIDFVVANHFMEHTEDPIAAIASHLRVLRDGGVLFLAVPDKRFSFDVSRPVTTVEHLVADHADGPERSRSAHYLEWARLVDGVPEAEAAAYATELERRRSSIHFHVWTPHAFAELLLHCGGAGLPLALEALEPVRHEFIAILRKSSG